MKSYNVATVGATGAVGEEMNRIIEERNFPVKNLLLLLPIVQLERNIVLREKITVKKLKDDSFKGIDIALFSGGDEVSKYYAPLAVQAGTVVIDNVYYRMDPEVPLIVPKLIRMILKNIGALLLILTVRPRKW